MAIIWTVLPEVNILTKGPSVTLTAVVAVVIVVTVKLLGGDLAFGGLPHSKHYNCVNCGKLYRYCRRWWEESLTLNPISAPFNTSLSMLLCIVLSMV